MLSRMLLRTGAILALSANTASAFDNCFLGTFDADIAVDAEWFPVLGVENSIRLTSTDKNAVVNWGCLPLNTALVNGVFTASTDSSYLGSPGTWAIQVEGISDATMASYTSAPVVVNP